MSVLRFVYVKPDDCDGYHARFHGVTTSGAAIVERQSGDRLLHRVPAEDVQFIHPPPSQQPQGADHLNEAWECANRIQDECEASGDAALLGLVGRLQAALRRVEGQS